MVVVFVFDNSLGLLRPFNRYCQESLLSVSFKIAKSITQKICRPGIDCDITIVKSASACHLSPFTSDPVVVAKTIDQLEELTLLGPYNLQDRISAVLTQVFKYWGSSVDVQLSQDLTRLNEQFSPNCAIFALNGLAASANNLKDNVQETVDKFLLQSGRGLWSGLNGETTPPPNISLACGHLKTLIYLQPPLARMDPIGSSASPTELCLEVFGFLHISDLSNPPVSSRHSLIPIPSGNEKDDESSFHTLLLSAMQDTKTVAMCSLYTLEPAVTNGKRSADPSSTLRQLWRHGFVHQFDAKLSVLMLSVFSADCTGLPWLGQFEHLAPVEDFAGVQLYDDREGSSPFPVLVPDRLSYGAMCDSSAPSRPAGTDPAFRYTSWVSPSSMLSDVNKVLRLGRRLPEKATLFFKELGKVRSAAMAYGCPQVLAHVARMTEAAHATELEQETKSSAAIQTHLETMNRLLVIPSD